MVVYVPTFPVAVFCEIVVLMPVLIEFELAAVTLSPVTAPAPRALCVALTVAPFAVSVERPVDVTVKPFVAAAVAAPAVAEIISPSTVPVLAAPAVTVIVSPFNAPVECVALGLTATVCPVTFAVAAPVDCAVTLEPVMLPEPVTVVAVIVSPVDVPTPTLFAVTCKPRPEVEAGVPAAVALKIPAVDVAAPAFPLLVDVTVRPVALFVPAADEAFDVIIAPAALPATIEAG